MLLCCWEEIGGGSTRALERRYVQTRVHEHRGRGEATTNLAVFHDGVDVTKKNWLGVFAQHINLGIGGMLPLQVSLRTIEFVPQLAGWLAGWLAVGWQPASSLARCCCRCCSIAVLQVESQLTNITC